MCSSLQSIDVEKRILWSSWAMVVMAVFFLGWAIYNMAGPKKMDFDGGVICTFSPV